MAKIDQIQGFSSIQLSGICQVKTVFYEIVA